MIADESHYATDSVTSPISRQLFFALMPLTIGLLASALIGYFAPQLSLLLLGDNPSKVGGYLMLGIVVLPFILASAYAEWTLTRAKQKNPDSFLDQYQP